MITHIISAGSSDVLSDFVRLATPIAPLTEWGQFYTNSTTGSKEWEMWLSRFDPVSDELMIIKSSGMAVPPTGSDVKAIPLPPTSGFGLTFKSIHGRTLIMQTGKGDASGPVSRDRGSVSVPLVHIRMPSNTDSNLKDFVTVKDSMIPHGGAYNLFYYKSPTGSKMWEIYAITNTLRDDTSGSPAVIVLISMGGVEIPLSGSDLAAVTMPTSMVDVFGITKSLGQLGFVKLEGPLRVFPA